MRVINLVINDFTHDNRVLKTSKTLQKLGHDVTVVALHNEQLMERETVDGVPVHRIKLTTRYWPKNIVIQVLKFIEFCVRFGFYYGRGSIIHCNDLEGLVLGVGCKALNWQLKLVYDSHEFAINQVPNQSKWSIKALYLLEKFFIRFACHVIVVSDTIANEYARLYSIKKPHLVLNCPEFKEHHRKYLFHQRFGIRSDQVVFLYQGGLSLGRGIETLLQAFEQRSGDRCVLVCMGYGPLEGLVIDYSRRCPIIFFHPAVDQSVLLDHTSSADFGISLIEDTCLSFRYCLPNKLFEYLMAGLPVIVSDLPEMRRLVNSESIGVVIYDNTVTGFNAAVDQILVTDISRTLSNVRNVRKMYCWETQEQVLMDIYSIH